MGFVWQMNRSINLIRWTVPSTASQWSQHRCCTTIIASRRIFFPFLLSGPASPASIGRDSEINGALLCEAHDGWRLGSRQWAAGTHFYRRHHTVDNLLCNRSRYCTFVWSSILFISHSVSCFPHRFRLSPFPSAEKRSWSIHNAL